MSARSLMPVTDSGQDLDQRIEQRVQVARTCGRSTQRDRCVNGERFFLERNYGASAVIPFEEEAFAVDAAIALRAAAAGSRHLHPLFDALVEILTGIGHRH